MGGKGWMGQPGADLGWMEACGKDPVQALELYRSQGSAPLLPTLETPSALLFPRPHQ